MVVVLTWLPSVREGHTIPWIILSTSIIFRNVMIVATWYNRAVMHEESSRCAPGSMVLLTRLAKQVYRRSDEELLGIHLRLLMALSYVRDHDGAPPPELGDALCMDAN